MDNGAAKWVNHSKGIRLCTDNFTKSEVDLLANKINEKYNWSISVYKQRNNYRLYIPNKNYEFSLYIFPFIIKSMVYKLPLPKGFINEHKSDVSLSHPRGEEAPKGRAVRP